MVWTTKKPQDPYIAHKWFAWYPVQIGETPETRKWAWLQTVIRCAQGHYDGYDWVHELMYRSLDDTIA